MCNECERLEGFDPISIEEIQSFPRVLMARLILKWLDNNNKNGIKMLKYSQYSFNITFLFTLFN